MQLSIFFYVFWVLYLAQEDVSLYSNILFYFIDLENIWTFNLPGIYLVCFYEWYEVPSCSNIIFWTISFSLTYLKQFLFKKDFTFDVGHFKVFIEFVTILLLFCVLVFGPEAYEILALPSGMNPHPLHWKAKSQALDSQGSPVILSYILNSQIPIDHVLASLLQSIDLLIFPKLVNILIVPALQFVLTSGRAKPLHDSWDKFASLKLSIFPLRNSLSFHLFRSSSMLFFKCLWFSSRFFYILKVYCWVTYMLLPHEQNHFPKYIL